MNTAYHPPSVKAVFLVKFDTSVGYEIVWSKTVWNINLSGIEYKCMPSGVHEFDQDLTLFSHKADKMYYGISKFRQLNRNAGSDNDRANISMYSLGCLCEAESTEWMPNTFVSNGFEYINYLDECLLTFLTDEENTSVLDAIDFDTIPVNKFTHPINSLPDFFTKFGPLVFKIYKLSLLRKRIIIFNQSKKDNYLIQVFNYIISVLSVIPSQLKFDFNRSQKDFLQPLYNICLHDLENNDLQLDSFVATTNDDILMYQPIYDYAIVLNDGLKCPEILSFQDVTQAKKDILKCTFNDYSKFKIIYKHLLNGDADPLPTNKSSDNLSINTSASVLSSFKFLGYGSSSEPNMSYEPNWWLKDSTYPLSWTQYIWSAFSWFASAGFNNQHIEANPEQASNSRPVDTVEMVEIVGYFHKLTKKWLYLIQDIIVDEMHNGNVVLTYQDLVNLELDPYSKHDVAFISDFVKLYWDVDSVEVSSGLNFFC
ncbi:hypothetical protein PSN45_002985 [Yamadazyma tenuis]|uniref:DUF4484 domain-containing protein n=1 Tax=Candida tenuis (strain ATCC 10573 / BCRC 21748 / CBS 615 / JCM 9827 / NBRC 10315 / NRRL Y-1498 / VKM Y-70) TaxID=590646 RepID=G3AW01_CANTC|nr:uncharacterized protein CANTEDRAFT_112147 [Yamadazyma tenuis ATCC 10573]EGV66419.1 hypothetical protein CANTEDRAFT_112147 [Yamadazyma tenuis ATCC 10573]WEJ95465.1 hypothetical protein PSN45_002985 [Yamadazyma tenuis]